MTRTPVKLYEMSFLVRDEGGIGKILSELLELGAEVVFLKEAEPIKLTYPINHLTSAYFGYVHFNFESGKIQDLNETLKLRGEVIRFLIVTPPPTVEDSRLSRREEPKPVERPPLAERSETLLSNEMLEEKLGEILGE